VAEWCGSPYAARPCPRPERAPTPPLGDALADALHRSVHREITRNDRVSAVLLPPDWYESARRVNPAPEPHPRTSRTGRDELTRILDAVEYENAHAAITRYGRPAAHLIPSNWYRAALDAESALHREGINKEP
jgi:PHD/YefM family antitoxin component YafN of YafNO toxin-antitoxin module